MQGQNLARFIIGILGNVISGLLFLSPSPTFWRICKKKSTEDFHPYPYIASVMRCSLWIFYGLPCVHPDSTLVITINSAGLLLELCYLAIFFSYTTKRNRGIIVLSLLAEAAAVAAVAVFTLFCFHTHAGRSIVVGTLCCFFGSVMEASPLTILREVVKTESAEFLPFWLCLACFCNGIVWFTYANLKPFDHFLASANGSEGLVDLIQLCVYGSYAIKARRGSSKPNDVPRSQIRLQSIYQFDFL